MVLGAPSSVAPSSDFTVVGSLLKGNNVSGKSKLLLPYLKTISDRDKSFTVFLLAASARDPSNNLA
jgi:hypothetical protein